MEEEAKIKYPILKGLNRSELFADLSDKAFDKMNLIGFPDRKSEEWKYTRVNKLLKANYLPKKNVELNQIENWIFPDIKGPTIVLENGMFNPTLSCLGANEGLFIKSLVKTNKEKVDMMEIIMI